MNLQKEQEEMRKREENHKEGDEDNKKLLEKRLQNWCNKLRL
jgi:hypothetical protein